MKDDNQDLAKLLHKDAKRIRETEAFDPKLHQDTMREIRLSESGEKRGQGFTWSPLKVFATTAIAVIALVLVLQPGLPPIQPEVHSGPEIALVTALTPGSALAYRQALAEGEDALLAMLDRDARVTLPKSAAVFQSKY